MSFRIRLLALSAIVVVGAAGQAEAQRGTIQSRQESFRIKRPAYGYFKYRIPNQSFRFTPRVEIQRDGLKRALERRQSLIDRQLAVQERVRERTRELRDQTYRRQLEARNRAMERVRDRMDRARLRPFAYRRWRTI